MTDDIDVAASRHAAYAIAHDNNAPATVTAYAGAVAAARHRAQLAGTTLACQLIAELSTDPAVHAAAVSIGPFGVLALQDWLQEVWGDVARRASETAVPKLTETERMYHRATIELLAETDPDASTAVLSFAGALAVAHIRWHTAGIDGRIDPAATAVIGAVLDEGSRGRRRARGAGRGDSRERRDGRREPMARDHGTRRCHGDGRRDRVRSLTHRDANSPRPLGSGAVAVVRYGDYAAAASPSISRLISVIGTSRRRPTLTPRSRPSLSCA